MPEAGSGYSAWDMPLTAAGIMTAGSTALKAGYQLVAVDLNADGKKDLLAIDEQASEVAWFENPTWQRQVLATNVPRPVF